MNAHNFCNTIGAIDSFQVKDNRLSVSGWTTSLQVTGITELRVSVGDLVISSIAHNRLPSPDVQAAFPAAGNAGNCRFTLDLELRDLHMELIARREVISITPWIGDAPGVPLERIWPPSFEVAASPESDLVGSGDFVDTSFHFLALFRLLAGLRRDEAILDVGCGLGRMAYAVAHYLGPGGSYNGFDSAFTLVEMARTRFQSSDLVKFQHIDVFNRMYNPTGRTKASDLTFPYESSSFSFVLLTSVFTHMLAGEVRNYLREIRRVTRSGGRCFATFFILNQDTERLIKEGKSTFGFRYNMPDGCAVDNMNVPENAVAYREEGLRAMVSEAGMKISQLHFGSWSGRAKFLSYQDVCILEPV